MTTTHILLVEDSPTQALRIRLLLEELGFQVRIVPDGRDGWLDACVRCPVLILLDVSLPSLTGLQVLLRLKRDRLTRHIPVIMLSNCDRIMHVEMAIELGADDYLFKGDCLQANTAYLLRSSIEQILHQTLPLASNSDAVSA
jgi:DNA-binding response OmpR family regulator